MFIDFVATVPLDEVCAHIFARARGNEAEAFPPLPAQKRCSSSSCRACEGRRRAARRRARPSSCASCASSRSRACYGCCARPRSGGCSESMRCARAAATESGRHPWFASPPLPCILPNARAPRPDRARTRRDNGPSACAKANSIRRRAPFHPAARQRLRRRCEASRRARRATTVPRRRYTTPARARGRAPPLRSGADGGEARAHHVHQVLEHDAARRALARLLLDHDPAVPGLPRGLVGVPVRPPLRLRRGGRRRGRRGRRRRRLRRGPAPHEL